jgi:hypothetical protein
MKGFLLGVIVAALAFGGYLYTKSRTGDGSAPRKVVAAADAGPTAKKRRKRTRGATRVARARSETTSAGALADRGAGSDRGPDRAPPRAPEPEPEPEPEPIKLSAADLKIVGHGDDLSRPDVIRMDMANDKDLPELAQEDIDARFRGEENAILECISAARPDQETYVPGRVTIKFRIQRAGTVRGVRVEAPAILQKGGLYGCVKGLVGKLRFPASGSSQIVTYPFTLS